MIEGRRKFRRTEVAWVARTLNVPKPVALKAMDVLYRNAVVHKLENGDPSTMTWCVRFYRAPNGIQFSLGLAPEAIDLQGRIQNAEMGLPAGTLCTRFYFREA